MIVYDVNHQGMMFKVIGIANKLQKHQKTNNYDDFYVIFRHFSKNRRKYFWTHSKYVKNTAKKNLISKKIQLSIFNGF